MEPAHEAAAPAEDAWCIRAGTIAGGEALRAVPWAWVLAAWAGAFAVGGASAAIVQAAGWWSGADWERAVLTAAQATVSPALDAVMLSLPYVGTNYSLVPFVALAAILLWRRGYPTVALHLAVAQLGSWALNPALKFTFPRVRPALFEARGQHAFPAFPSGHAIAVVAVLVTAAYLIHRCDRGTWAYWVVGAFFLLNSYSRVYLAVHWPTDVVAGALVGGVWMGALVVLFGRVHRLA